MCTRPANKQIELQHCHPESESPYVTTLHIQLLKYSEMLTPKFSNTRMDLEKLKSTNRSSGHARSETNCQLDRMDANVGRNAVAVLSDYDFNFF